MSASLNYTLVCEFELPTAPPSDPFKTLQVVIYVLASIFILSTSIFYFILSSKRSRLKVRSINSILFGSCGTVMILLCRAYYGSVGREFLQCNGYLALVYAFALFNLVVDISDAVCYLAKRHIRLSLIQTSIKTLAHDIYSPTGVKKRQIQNEIVAMVVNSAGGKGSAVSVEDNVSTMRSTDNLSMAASSHTGGIHHKTSAPRPSQCWPAHIATPLEYLKGLGNLISVLVKLAAFDCVGKRMKQNPFQLKARLKMSFVRELSYDFVIWTIWGSVFYSGIAITTSVIPRYQSRAKCPGCQMDALDVGVFFVCIACFLLSTVQILHRMRLEDDPFRVFADLRFMLLVYLSLSILTYTLIAVDPSGLMHSQQVDWHIFEALIAVLLHYRRCVLPMIRARRIQKKPELPLLAILNYPEMCLLFEKHLGKELATESLLFWKETVKFKLGFEADFDHAQTFARMISRQFIGKRAQLEINISEDQADNLIAKFRSGFVGKNVFDEAMIEIFQLMEKGPYPRFLRSKEFLEYAKTSADFTMMMVVPVDALEGGEGHHHNQLDNPMHGASGHGGEEFRLPISDWLRKL